MKIRGNAYQNTKRAAVAPGRRVGATDSQEIRHEQEVLRTVVQDDRMPEALSIRKLDRPPHVGDAADDLAVDEVANPPDAHEKRPWDDQEVGQLQERLPVHPREQPGACGGANQKPVRGHSSQPIRRDEPGMLADRSSIRRTRLR